MAFLIEVWTDPGFVFIISKVARTMESDNNPKKKKNGKKKKKVADSD